eukprot:GHVS01015059.1.p1 GENE.GHVS01015059.1~~GHVS01015059.1.p1  ORF type:complete len:262 (+),score=61.42 GHVS01015059.1:205-990(+)
MVYVGGRQLLRLRGTNNLGYCSSVICWCLNIMPSLMLLLLYIILQSSSSTGISISATTEHNESVLQQQQQQQQHTTPQSASTNIYSPSTTTLLQQQLSIFLTTLMFGPPLQKKQQKQENIFSRLPPSLMMTSPTNIASLLPVPLAASGFCSAGSIYTLSTYKQVYSLIPQIECLFASAVAVPKVPIGGMYGRLLTIGNSAFWDAPFEKVFQGDYVVKTRCHTSDPVYLNNDDSIGDGSRSSSAGGSYYFCCVYLVSCGGGA